MPRENLSSGGEPNPAVRWLEWNGETGNLFYYDKEAPHPTDPSKQGANIQLAADFTFILLHRLGVVKGWDEKGKSGITSNEVADTRTQPLIVRSFKGGKIAEGIYADIKDRVAVAGGRFCASCYIAFKLGGKLEIGNIRFGGAALAAWFDFERNHKKDLYTKAIRIFGYEEGKKGKVTFRVPKFEVKDITPQTDDEAGVLQQQVKEFLTGYFSRTSVAQAEAPQPPPAADQDDAAAPAPAPASVIADDDVPF